MESARVSCKVEGYGLLVEQTERERDGGVWLRTWVCSQMEEEEEQYDDGEGCSWFGHTNQRVMGESGIRPIIARRTGRLLREEKVG